jgi:hypothetical protein
MSPLHHSERIRDKSCNRTRVHKATFLLFGQHALQEVQSDFGWGGQVAFQVVHLGRHGALMVEACNDVTFFFFDHYDMICKSNTKRDQVEKQ